MMTRWSNRVAILLASAIGLEAADELLLNGSFESPTVATELSETNPENWTLFSSVADKEKIGLLQKTSHSGKQAARLSTQATEAAYQGMFQSLPVSLGATYKFSVYVRSDGDQPLKGTGRGQISVEWKDSSGGEIERSWGPDWGESLSSSQWTKFEMLARPPANASRAHFVITQFDGKDASGRGAFLVDDASVTAQP